MRMQTAWAQGAAFGSAGVPPAFLQCAAGRKIAGKMPALQSPSFVNQRNYISL
jgi:hypothetical protein